MVAITFSKTRFQPLGEAGGQFYGRKISEEQKRTPDLGIVLRAALAFSKVSLHANQLDPGQGIVYERNVLITKLATIHGDRLRVRNRVPASGAPVPEPSDLIYVWCNDFRERVSRPVKPGFDRTQVALRDLRDLLVGLALELPQDEHIPVVLGKLGDALLDDLPQMTLTVHVIWTGGGVFELEGTIIVLKVLLNRLKKNQR